MNLHLGRLQNQYRKVNNLFMFARIFAQDSPIQVQDYSEAGLPCVIHTMQIAFNDRIEPIELSRVCDEFIQKTVADLITEILQ